MAGCASRSRVAVGLINIMPSGAALLRAWSSCTVPPKQTSRGVADAFYCSSAPMKVYGLVTPTGESYRALTPV